MSTRDRATQASTAADLDQLYEYQSARGTSSVPLRLRRATLAYTRAADELLLSAAGLTSARFIVLAAIEARPGISNSALAALTSQRPQSVQDTTASLEREQLIERRPGTGRQRLHYVTAAGAKVLATAGDAIRGLHDRLLGGLTPGQVTALNSTLDTIIRTLEESE